MKKTLFTLLFLVIILGAFASGAFFGVQYEHLLYPLCSEPKLFVTQSDLSSDNIIIKKGTLVSLRECEYADRFSIMFYAPNKLETNLFSPYAPKTEEEISEFSKSGLSLAQYGVSPASTEEHPNQTLKRTE